MTEMKDRITGIPNTGESPKYDATQTAVSYKPLKPAVVVRNQRDLGDVLIGFGLISTFLFGLFMAWFG